MTPERPVPGPKKFLQIRIPTDSVQPVSCAYFDFPGKQIFAAIDHTPVRPDPLYAPVWSWVVLKMHWLPVYLAFLSLAILLRFRHAPGLWMWSLGAAAFLTPAVVDFGNQEQEYFRWEFAAGMGLAGALGLAVARLAEYLAATVPKRRALVGLGVIMVLWLGTLRGQATLGNLVKSIAAVGNVWNSAFLLDSEAEWLLRNQRTLDMTPGDLALCSLLSEHARMGDRLLSSFPQEAKRSVDYEATVAGLTGVFPIGHAMPLPSDPVGTRPFRMSDEVRAFWNKPNGEASRTSK